MRVGGVKIYRDIEDYGINKQNNKQNKLIDLVGNYVTTNTVFNLSPPYAIAMAPQPRFRVQDYFHIY